MKDIEQELDVLIGKEGGYTNNPNDSGGETIWGITKFTADSFGYKDAMKDMSRDQAKEIYRARYWIQPKFDQVYKINPGIAMEMFDTGVNMGAGTAVKFLQRALNVLNQGGKIYPDMAVDGGLGAMTLAALQKFLDTRNQDGVVVMMRMLNAQQAVKYMEIAEANAKNEDFIYGWQLNRVEM
jgi:lysozyme family protein